MQQFFDTTVPCEVLSACRRWCGCMHLRGLRTTTNYFRSLNEFAITETELKLIAAAAIIGLNSRPVTG